MLDEKKWIFYGVLVILSSLQDLFCDFPQFGCTLNSSTHTSLFTKIWRLQDLTYQYGRIKKGHFAHLVKRDDSPALAVLHPLEMRKYPLIHDLGMLSLGRAKDLKRQKGIRPRRKD